MEFTKTTTSQTTTETSTGFTSTDETGIERTFEAQATIPREQHEFDMLARLKGLSELRASQQGSVTHGTPASRMASAFGKLSTGVAIDRGVPASVIQQAVLEEYPTSVLDEIKLASELRHEANERLREDYDQFGYVTSATAKFESAAAKLETAVVQEMEEAVREE